MIARERFPFQYDLVSILRRSVEARHQKMQVASQCPHSSNLALLCTNNLAERPRWIIAYVQPWTRELVIQRFEMAKHALRAPYSEVPIHISLDALGLQTK